eukprot:617983-Amphidinium_carterae.1
MSKHSKYAEGTHHNTIFLCLAPDGEVRKLNLCQYAPPILLVMLRQHAACAEQGPGTTHSDSNGTMQTPWEWCKAQCLWMGTPPLCSSSGMLLAAVRNSIWQVEATLVTN